MAIPIRILWFSGKSKFANCRDSRWMAFASSVFLVSEQLWIAYQNCWFINCFFITPSAQVLALASKTLRLALLLISVCDLTKRLMIAARPPPATPPPPMAAIRKPPPLPTIKWLTNRCCVDHLVNSRDQTDSRFGIDRKRKAQAKSAAAADCCCRLFKYTCPFDQRRRSTRNHKSNLMRFAQPITKTRVRANG